MRHALRGGILLSALLIVASGCAVKEWVADRLGTQEAEHQQRSEDGQVSASAQEANGRPAQVLTLDVQFGFDRSDLTESAKAQLVALTKKLRESAKLTVNLEGYADSVGTRDYNLHLSQKRVEAVRRYLVERGVEPARIRSVGLGPLTDRGTPTEQTKNRRVTVRLLAPAN